MQLMRVVCERRVGDGPFGQGGLPHRRLGLEDDCRLLGSGRKGVQRKAGTAWPWARTSTDRSVPKAMAMPRAAPVAALCGSPGTSWSTPATRQDKIPATHMSPWVVGQDPGNGEGRAPLSAGSNSGLDGGRALAPGAPARRATAFGCSRVAELVRDCIPGWWLS